MLVAGFVVTLLVMGVLVSLVLGLGVMGMAIVAVVTAALTVSAYMLGYTLPIRLTGAKPADPHTHARLDNLVDGLCATTGVTRPRVLVIEDDAANAFVCGRGQRRACVVVTSGLLAQASRIELEGVLARELDQIKSGEAAFNSVVAGLIGIPAAASDRALRYWWGQRPPASGPESESVPPSPMLPHTPGRTVLSAICLPLVPLAPLMARLVHVFVPTDHDGFADLAAVGVTRYPPGLADALERMHRVGTVIPRAGRVTAHLWVAEPLPTPAPEGIAGRTLTRFVTHLPLEERADALRER